MYDLLAGMRVVEAAAFVAGPSCALHLAQFGAEVIRIDAIGGGPDFHRWPISRDSGSSLYWEGLNKSKKSVALDLSRPEGRELAMRIITAPGSEAGLFVTNYPVDGFLAYERLAKRRSDLICVRIMGWPDGRSAVDYTVNASVGLPEMTGPVDGCQPVNHVLPAWDLLTGAYAAFSMVSAERARRADRRGREIRIPLSDVAIASLGQLGQIGEVQITGRNRERYGNELYGTFGRDFITRDAKRLMVVAITPRQWKGLVAALGLEEEINAIEAELDVRFAENEGARFEHRSRLMPVVEQAIARVDASQLATAFEDRAVCWGPYQSLHEAVRTDPYFSAANPILSEIEHPSGHRYLAAGSAATLPEDTRRPPQAAPMLGRDTEQVLSELLGLSTPEIAELRDAGLVASA
jgi:2-methylfumaryl-CoA isomerase